MIEAQFLHEVAEYVSSRIAKVVLNDSYVITEFTAHSVEDGMVALNYIVPAAQVPFITLIELRDANDGLIQSNAVSVPITSDTKMLQTVDVKEVSA